MPIIDPRGNPPGRANAAPLPDPPARRAPLAARFFADPSGGLVVGFALLGLGLVVAVGAAVDIARWLHARSDALQAVDAAVLAGGRSLQLGRPGGEAVAAAVSYYRDNSRDRLPLESDSIAFTVIDDGIGFTAMGAAYIATPFLAIAGVPRLPLLQLTGAEYAQARLAVGANARASFEIALILDVSASMRGEKLTALKAAARDFVEIVVWDDQSRRTSRVALAPFSSDIRLASALLLAARDPAMTGPFQGEPYDCLSGSNWVRCTDVYLRRNCVVERTGDDRYTAAGPGPGRYVMALFTRSDRNCSTPAASPVAPLSDDKAAIRTAIDGLATGSGRAGHLGAAWGWYLLSPEWAGVLPASGRPGPSADPHLRKIAILMTVGAFNVAYSSYGIVAGTAAAPAPAAPANASSADQAAMICAGMRAAGIEVFTVGLGIAGNTAAIDTLRTCASGPDHAYLADTGGQLRPTFQDIATRIVTLHLSY